MRFFARRMRVMYAVGDQYAHTDALVPVDALSHEALAKVPEHATARVEASIPRNGAHHRFYFALLAKIRDNLPEHLQLDTEALHDVIKMGAGFTYTVKLPNGAFYQLPRSIKFSELDETGFREFMDRAIPFIATELVPQMDEEVLMNEVLDFLSGGSA